MVDIINVKKVKKGFEVGIHCIHEVCGNKYRNLLLEHGAQCAGITGFHNNHGSGQLL